jgi:hypothetical protein
MSLVAASSIMLLDGVLYCGLGGCMLYPSCLPRGHTQLARLYPSLFKAFLFSQPPTAHPFDHGRQAQHEESDGMIETGVMDEDQNLHDFKSVLNASVRPLGELVHDLGFRLLGYLLILVGVCRVITGLHWGCGYIHLGLSTSLAEIAMVCNELLRAESVLLHRAMAVLLTNMVLSLLYLSAGLPHCSS